MYSWEIWTALVAITILLCYLHMTRKFNYWKNLNIEYAKPIPFFGSMLDVIALRCSMPQVMQKLHSSSKASCVGFFMYDQPYLLIRDSWLIKEVLIKDFEYFDNRSILAAEHDKLGSNLLFIVDNPKWRTLRVALSPVFTTGKMKLMLPLLLEASDDLISYLKNVGINSEYTEVRGTMLKYTTDVISSCAFGINVQCFKNENNPFRLAAQSVFNTGFKSSMTLLAYFVAPFLVNLLKINFVDTASSKFFVKVFWQHIREREMSKTPRGDLIDILLKLQKEETLDDYALVGQPVQFLIAGYETTGTMLAFGFYQLALQPNIQNKVRQEIKEVLNKHGNITYEVLKQMEYLDNVVSELLRMYPVLPLLDRRCSKDYQLPGTNAVIEKGTPVYISLLGLHYDPDNFPDPYKFDPDRFKDFDKINSTIYMPFGTGPRNCIGARFALLSAKVALFRVLSEFEVTLCETTPNTVQIDPKGIFYNPLNGKLDVRFRKYESI